MAQTPKSLGQADLAANTLTNIYTVPGATSAIARVTLANRTAANINIHLAHAPAGAANTNAHFHLFNFNLPANDAWTTPYTIEMATTDQLRARADAAGVTAAAHGLEIT